MAYGTLSAQTILEGTWGIIHSYIKNNATEVTSWYSAYPDKWYDSASIRASDLPVGTSHYPTNTNDDFTFERRINNMTMDIDIIHKSTKERAQAVDEVVKLLEQNRKDFKYTHGLANLKVDGVTFETFFRSGIKIHLATITISFDYKHAKL